MNRIASSTYHNRYKWRTAFFCPAAIALLPQVICFFLVPKDVPDKKQNKKMDWLGAALMTAANTLFLVALTSSQTAAKRWAAPCKRQTKVDLIMFIRHSANAGSICVVSWLLSFMAAAPVEAT